MVTTELTMAHRAAAPYITPVYQAARHCDSRLVAESLCDSIHIARRSLADLVAIYSGQSRDITNTSCFDNLPRYVNDRDSITLLLNN
jgi:hypothetical protein